MADGWRLGCIGVGAMGQALVSGIIKAGIVTPDRVAVADADEKRAQEVACRFSVGAGTNAQVAAQADVLLVAVNPGHVTSVLAEVDSHLSDDAVVISVAAGVPLAALERALSARRAVIRAMPNTPCLIGAGVTALSLGRWATPQHGERAQALFEAVGYAVTVPESLMDAVTGLSGSGPAYVFTVINALADGGVTAGLPRDVARDLAVYTVLGSARLVAETGDHPIVLRDRVTSPGGTTAAGLSVLEGKAVVSAFIEAVRAAARRAGEMARELADAPPPRLGRAAETKGSQEGEAP